MTVNPTAALPVTVVGGYLGAGKTTLVNHVLRNADGLRIAVLVNEFGQLPIDADLIEAQDDNIISIAGGCVCCSYGNDLMLAMIDLAQMTPAPEHVLLEASGVALPGAIAASVGLLAHYTLDGVVVLADAETLRQRAADRYMGDTVCQQLREADLLVLNKTDLATPDTLAETRRWLAATFGETKVVEACHAQLPRDLVLGQVRAERDLSHPVTLHHGALFETVSLPLKQPVDPDWLAAVLVRDDLGVIRAKGFVRTVAGTCSEIQIVGRRWTTKPIPTAPYTGIVCIGAAGTFVADKIRSLVGEEC